MPLLQESWRRYWLCYYHGWPVKTKAGSREEGFARRYPMFLTDFDPLLFSYLVSATVRSPPSAVPLERQRHALELSSVDLPIFDLCLQILRPCREFNQRHGHDDFSPRSFPRRFCLRGREKAAAAALPSDAGGFPLGTLQSAFKTCEYFVRWSQSHDDFPPREKKIAAFF